MHCTGDFLWNASDNLTRRFDQPAFDDDAFLGSGPASIESSNDRVSEPGTHRSAGRCVHCGTDDRSHGGTHGRADGRRDPSTRHAGARGQPLRRGSQSMELHVLWWQLHHQPAIRVLLVLQLHR